MFATSTLFLYEAYSVVDPPKHEQNFQNYGVFRMTI